MIKKKGANLMLNRKDRNGKNLFNSRIDKKRHSINIFTQYFPKLHFLVANVKVEIDLSSYTTKSNLKSATGKYIGFC